MQSRLSLIEALRKTLADIEKDKEFSPEDPVAAQLKAILLQRIADLERDACESASSDTTIPQAAD